MVSAGLLQAAPPGSKPIDKIVWIGKTGKKKSCDMVWANGTRVALRFQLAIGGMALLALTASAQAGSFVTIAPPKPDASPSIVALGAPMPRAARDETGVDPIRTTALPRPGVHLSRSIIVLGEPKKNTETGQVAIYTLRELARVPMVFRGGEAGGASSTIRAKVAVAGTPAGESALDGAAGDTAKGEKPADTKKPASPADPEPKPAVAPGPSTTRME